MSKSPVLSVVTMTYQSRDEIEACLASIPVCIQGRPIQIIYNLTYLPEASKAPTVMDEFIGRV